MIFVEPAESNDAVTNRRQFVQSSLALSAAILAIPSIVSARPRASADTTLELERFVYDDRYPEAIETARHLAQRGIPVASTSGDMTQLWYHDFDLRWKRAPMALAGMTAKSGLFVLETLAADRGMRVVYRGEHTLATSGRVTHRLSGPAPLIARVAGDPDAPVWGACLGEALTLCPLGKPRAMQLELTTPAGSAMDCDETLFSWIIAPRSSVSLTV